MFGRGNSFQMAILKYLHISTLNFGDVFTLKTRSLKTSRQGIWTPLGSTSCSLGRPVGTNKYMLRTVLVCTCNSKFNLLNVIFVSKEHFLYEMSVSRTNVMSRWTEGQSVLPAWESHGFLHLQRLPESKWKAKGNPWTEGTANAQPPTSLGMQKRGRKTYI